MHCLTPDCLGLVFSLTKHRDFHLVCCSTCSHQTLQKSRVCFILITVHIFRLTALPKMLLIMSISLLHHNRKILLSHTFVIRHSLVSKTNTPTPDPAFQYQNTNFTQLLFSKTEEMCEGEMGGQREEMKLMLVCLTTKSKYYQNVTTLS